jgi:hypothetical protein
MPKRTVKLPVTENYLSVRQPDAWAIIAGFKDIENRWWPTNIRGRIFIHAGKNKTQLQEGMEYLQRKGVKRLPREEDLTFGAIIGSVEIVACVDKHRSKWRAKSVTFGFVLANPRRLKVPVPLKANAKMQRVPKIILNKIKKLNP